MGTASRPSPSPHRSIHTKTGVGAQVMEAAVGLLQKEGADLIDKQGGISTGRLQKVAFHTKGLKEEMI